MTIVKKMRGIDTHQNFRSEIGSSKQEAETSSYSQEGNYSILLT